MFKINITKYNNKITRMNQYTYEKYITNIENIKETINKYGVAIVPNLLDDNECNKIIDEFWDYFEHITSDWDCPISRNKKETWNEIYKLYPNHSMLFQHWGIGHSQVCWDVRQNEKIINVFSKIWKCKKEDLLVSFDGASFNIPPEQTSKGWHKNTWYHSDQSYTRNNFECIQSWVTGIDVNEGDATLAIMEGSNKYHEEFSKHFNITDKSDWYKLNEEEELFYLNKGCEYKKIKCPKGSLVLWDSRTIHCGTKPLKNRMNSNFRAVIYVCYLPRILCDKKNLVKKQKAFNELRTTNHYPCKIKLFPKTPYTYGKPLLPIKQINKPILNDIGKKLAGF